MSPSSTSIYLKSLSTSLRLPVATENPEGGTGISCKHHRRRPLALYRLIKPTNIHYSRLLQRFRTKGSCSLSVISLVTIDLAYSMQQSVSHGPCPCAMAPKTFYQPTRSATVSKTAIQYCGTSVQIARHEDER